MPSSLDLHAASPFGTILYIGAGEAQDLGQFQDLNPQQILLVEANPARARALEKQVAGQAGIEILSVAVGGFTGQGRLRILNMPEYSSLRPFTGLSDLFPGIRETRQTDVDTYMAHELVSQLDLPEDRAHVLILDAPGVEEVILHSLIAHDQLTRFEYVILRAGIEPFYEGNKGLDALIPMATQAGFRAVGRSEEDPDFPQATLVKDPLTLENRALQEKQTTLEARLKTLEGTLKTAQARATKAEGAWKEVNESLKAKTSELAETTDKLTAAQARATKAEGAWKEVNESLKAKTSELSETADKLTAAQARATKAEADLAAQAEILSMTKTAAQTEQNALKERLAQREEALERKEMDLGVALRSQSALQMDLQTLRNNYETLRAEKTAQDKLLLQVTTRLNAASRYLHMLNAAPGETATPELDSPESQEDPAPQPAAKPTGKSRARKTSAPRKKRGATK
ncbi:MAG: hypothetical protein CML69_16760 [Rhodobacteraceae bacterium]|nr:hypothetical protein [Paracoccaceae bacterium]